METYLHFILKVVDSLFKIDLIVWKRMFNQAILDELDEV